MWAGAQGVESKRMADKRPFTWMPADVVVVTNVSKENFNLNLASGPLRLDAGRTLRLTASALEQLEVVALANVGKVKIEPYKRK